MKFKEAHYLKATYPFLSIVLQMISRGVIIKESDPFWPTYLIARQRGLVERMGPSKEIIGISNRGKEYLSSKIK